jgi:phage shock protein PspC (stress-responsive transcriptional regulator)
MDASRRFVGDFDVRRRLARSPSDAMLAGVCSGLARYLGLDPTLIRVLYVAASLFALGIGGVIAYVIFWAIMPREV